MGWLDYLWVGVENTPQLFYMDEIQLKQIAREPGVPYEDKQCTSWGVSQGIGRVRPIQCFGCGSNSISALGPFFHPLSTKPTPTVNSSLVSLCFCSGSTSVVGFEQGPHLGSFKLTDLVFSVCLEVMHTDKSPSLMNKPECKFSVYNEKYIHKETSYPYLPICTFSPCRLIYADSEIVPRVS